LYNLKKLHFIIAFISFIGYFIGLTLIVQLSFPSRYYSVPVRFFVAFLMLISLYKSKKIFSFSYTNLLFFYFWFVYLIFSIRYFLFDNLSLSYFLDIFGYSLVYSILPFVFYSNLPFKSYLAQIKFSIILSGLILSIIAFFQYWDDFISSGVSRLGNVVYYEGDDYKYLSDLALSYSASLIMGLSIFNIFYQKDKLVIKLMYLLIIIVSLIPFLLGSSRGAVFSLLFPFVFFVFFKRGKSLSRSILITFSFISFSIIAFFIAENFGSSAFTRVFTIASDIDSGSDSAARLDIWYTSILQFYDNPIFGDYVLNRKWNFYPHNLFVEILMATGILGFLPFCILIFLAFRKTIKIIKYNPEESWVTIIFLQGFVMGSFSGSVTDNIIFWAGMGLVFSVDNLNKGFNE
jgi:O-antigen ligase